jgi:hypothetical protein
MLAQSVNSKAFIGTVTVLAYAMSNTTIHTLDLLFERSQGGQQACDQNNR